MKSPLKFLFAALVIATQGSVAANSDGLSLQCKGFSTHLIIENKKQIKKDQTPAEQTYEISGKKLVSINKMTATASKYQCKWSDKIISCNMKEIKEENGKRVLEDAYIFFDRQKGTVQSWDAFLDPKLSDSDRLLKTVDQDTQYFEGECKKLSNKF